MTRTFQVETFDHFFADAQSLIKDQWEEVATFPDIRKLLVGEENYRNAERGGGLLVVTLRVDGVLQGYVLSIVGRNLHSMETIASMQDAYYVAAAHRGAWLSLNRRWEAESRARGATILESRQKFVNGLPVAPDRLFELQGYEKGSVSWYKRA